MEILIIATLCAFILTIIVFILLAEKFAGPSDGAIDAYYALKERDPDAAAIFLKRIMSIK